LTRQVSPDLYDRAYYDAVQGGDTWRQSRGRRLPPRLAAAVRVARPKPGERVLDIGTGRGEVALHTALGGCEALGIDYAEGALEIAREALQEYGEEVRARCHFEVMDCTRLPLEDGSQDVIFMLDLVEHLYPEQLARALAEARRVLRPGGRLVIHTEPNRSYAEATLALYNSRALGWLARPVVRLLTGSPVPFSTYRAEMHVNEQSPAMLRRALAEAGFHARVWTTGIYSWRELRSPRTLFKRVGLGGWPVTALPALRERLGINVWALAHP
jgi:ubiquinone/menaquinone biosynthesis C-methylase UbiE